MGLEEDFNEFVDYYMEHFVDIFFGLTIYVKKYPRQILFEQSNALSHLMQFWRDKNPDSNLSKARGHIERATLDTHKLYWARVSKKVNDLVFNSYWKRQTYKTGDGNLFVDWDEFRRLSDEARRHELDNIGMGSKRTPVLYMAASKQGENILGNVDLVRADKLQKRAVNSRRFGITYGVLASFISSFLVYVVWLLWKY